MPPAPADLRASLDRYVAVATGAPAGGDGAALADWLAEALAPWTVAGHDLDVGAALAAKGLLNADGLLDASCAWLLDTRPCAPAPKEIALREALDTYADRRAALAAASVAALAPDLAARLRLPPLAAPPDLAAPPYAIMPPAGIAVPDVDGLVALLAWFRWARPFAPALKNPLAPLVAAWIDAHRTAVPHASGSTGIAPRMATRWRREVAATFEAPPDAMVVPPASARRHGLLAGHGAGPGCGPRRPAAAVLAGPDPACNSR